MAPLPLSHDEPATEDRAGARGARRAGRWWFSLAAAGWGAAGGILSGTGWVVGVGIARVHLGVDVLAVLREQDVAKAAALLAGQGVVLGLLGGAVVGLVLGGLGRAGETVVPGALIGGAFGAVGGALTPCLLAATGAWLAPEVGSATAWAVAGLLAGLAGYGWGGPRTEEDEDDWTEGRVAVSGPRDTRRPSARLLTVIGLAVACLVVALATPASDAGWAVLAVGLLGLAVASALSGQERRIRDLERQLREREDS